MTVTIRPATQDDARAIAEARIESWRFAYRGIVPGLYLDAMKPENSVDRWRAAAAGERPDHHLLVSEDDGMLIGFAMVGPARDPEFGYSSELHAIYFRSHAVGRGHGRALFEACRAWLCDAGHADMMLWVMEDNVRAQRFYERAGGVLLSGSRRSFEIMGKTVWELAYGVRPLCAGAASR